MWQAADLAAQWVLTASQVDPARFKSIPVGFNLVMAEQGAKGLFKGWGPTAVGYSAQGACKFGFYEFFKKCVRLPSGAGCRGSRCAAQVLLRPGRP